MKNTDKNCTVIFDEDEVVMRNKSTGETRIRQRIIDGMYSVSIDLFKLSDEPSAAVAVEELPADYQRILRHRRLAHDHNDKLIESDRRGLVEGQPGQEVYQKEA